jgi:hypothetical protein
VFWLALVTFAALLALAAVREITFMAGPPVRGYAPVFLIVFGAIFLIILCIWAFSVFIWQRLHRKPPENI